jgi:cytochrome b
VLGVAAYRILWGFVGTRWARFASFLRAPKEAWNYLAGLLRLAPAHHTGHNPAGGWAVAFLLGLALATGATGWLAYQEIGGEALGEFHEGIAATMLVLVVVHVLAVLLSSVLHRENLVGAMITGRKLGAEGDAISSVRPLAALTLLAWTVVLAWWVSR